MILIISRKSDPSIDSVIEWLLYLEKKFFRIDYSPFSLNFDSETGDCSISTMFQKNVNANEVTSIFFSGYGNFNYVNHDPENPVQMGLPLSEIINNERNALLYAFLKKIPNPRIYGLCPFERFRINKMDVLQKAAQHGLYTPKSAIVNTYTDLFHYKQKWGSIVTKCLSEGGTPIFTSDYIVNPPRTELVDDNYFVNKEGNSFLPSLVQEYIEKEFEIRTIYFAGSFWSIAILSNGQEQARIDFRNGINLRMIPFSLPQNTLQKLRCLLDDLKLNYAAIDLIQGKNGCIYLLEINPFGQFGFVSVTGNYYIEKEIAKIL